MKGDGSLPPTNDLSARLALLQAANEGRLENLRCPQCGEAAVSVWFAHPAVNVYRTWFVCDRCSFEMCAENSGPPVHYSAERDWTQQADPRPELIERLRALASRGTTVRELTREIIHREGLKEGAFLPILWYFSQAFCLPLPVVLPIREWLGTDRDQEIDATLLPAITESRCRWVAATGDDHNGPALDTIPGNGLTASQTRS